LFASLWQEEAELYVAFVHDCCANASSDQKDAAATPMIATANPRRANQRFENMM
jgi:hypothetical protein